MKKLESDLPKNYKRPQSYRIYDINSREAETLLTNLAPDVCLLTIHRILEERILSIPKLGMLVFHPGITPEYRGPHSAFWATFHIFMQHQSHVEGLPHVVQILRELEIGEKPFVSGEGRVSTNYTHPGITDYFRLRRLLKRLRVDHHASQAQV